MTARLAVGILAAKAPAVLEQALANWDPDLCQVYVHVDAKFDSSQYAFLANYHHVRFIEPRVEVFWGGFTMVEAEFTILRAAAIDGFDFLVLHSDDALPLMGPRRMLDVLQQGERWLPIGGVEAQEVRSRYDNYYCLDAAVSHPLIHKWNFEDADLSKLSELAALRRSGKYPLPTLFWSSQWKALRSNDVEHLLYQHSRGGHFLESFRFSMIPDEHYIPSLLGRRAEGARMVSRFLWTDFTRHPRPYIFSAVEELQPARDDGFLFIRKIHDPQVAREVVLENLRADR